MEELIEVMKQINENLTMIRQDLDDLSCCVYEPEDGKARVMVGGGVNAYLYWD